MRLAEKVPRTPHKRVLELIRCFYEGIANLSLARDSHEQKYRQVAEEAVKDMVSYIELSQWNFLNKYKLMLAELRYLNGNLQSADDAYNASIAAAHQHQFLNEEALAHELYGMFLIENTRIEKGVRQLHLAIEKYRKWSAHRKVKELELFIDLVDPSFMQKLTLE